MERALTKWIPKKRTSMSLALTTTKILECISECGNFGPLKGVVRLLGQVIEMLREIGDNDEECEDLIKQLYDLTSEINSHAPRDEAERPEPHDYWDRINKFQSKIEELQRKAMEVKEREKSELIRFATKDDEVKKDIKDIGRSLVKELFELQAGLSINTNKMVHDLNQAVCELRSTIQHEKVSSSSQISSEEHGLLEELGRNYIELQAHEWQFLVDWPKGSPDHFFTNEVLVRGTKRLAKTYAKYQRKEWLEDIKRFCKLKHTNLPQLMGYAKEPNLVIFFHNDTPRSVGSYIKSISRDKLDIKLLEMTVQALQAIDFLSIEFKLSNFAIARLVQNVKFSFDSWDRLIVYPPVELDQEYTDTKIVSRYLVEKKKMEIGFLSSVYIILQLLKQRKLKITIEITDDLKTSHTISLHPDHLDLKRIFQLQYLGFSQKMISDVIFNLFPSQIQIHKTTEFGTHSLQDLLFTDAFFLTRKRGAEIVRRVMGRYRSRIPWVQEILL